MSPRALIVAALFALVSLPHRAAAQTEADALHASIDRLLPSVEADLVRWRRDFHAHPELGNRETRTAAVIAKVLRDLGYEVRTGVAHTGVVATLRGGKKGPVVALRSDMDALPVTEEVDVPYRSKVRTTYAGEEVGVMHACGHDNHMAMLLGAAAVLAKMQKELPGTVRLLFQPAEEGPPAGETGGAELMIAEGALEHPHVDAIFGVHVFPYPLGTIAYRSGGLMASADHLKITIHGRQTHGALPWAGVDPVVVAAEVILGLQTVVSRELDITQAPAVVTIGKVRAGSRSNIIPDTAELSGTIRSLDPEMRKALHTLVERKVKAIAESAGATAEVKIGLGAPVVYNDPALTRLMAPTLARIGGPKLIDAIQPTTTAEDFAEYQAKIPGLFFFLGVLPPGRDPKTAEPNHSPRFVADEAALPIGVRALTSLVVDYLAGPRP